MFIYIFPGTDNTKAFHLIVGGRLKHAEEDTGASGSPKASETTSPNPYSGLSEALGRHRADIAALTYAYKTALEVQRANNTSSPPLFSQKIYQLTS